jgi:D-sedoheptulose 7-phosphate isomerase
MIIDEQVNRRMEVLNYIKKNLDPKISSVEDKLVSIIKNGGKILTCGNGGSAANAQHFTGDMVGRYKMERKGYPSITLTVDNCAFTAISNDYSYEDCFAREVETLGTMNDGFIAFSSSAKSENIVRAIKKAKEIGMFTVAIVGNQGGKVNPYADICLAIPQRESDISEEAGLFLLHVILEEVEKTLCR